MDYFRYRDGQLFCEDCSLEQLAQQFGTPLYVYSAATLRHHYRSLARAFAPLRPTVCFSIKSLSNLHVLRLLGAEGSGFDVVSGGELMRARLAGADMHKVVYAGVGKTDREINEALAAGIAWFNVESEAEFENLSRLAGLSGKPARAALRVNPDVYDPRTHTYTATGRKETKFGVDIERAVAFFGRYGSDPHVRLDGIHLHIGSPIYSPDPYVQAIAKALELIERLRGMGVHVAALNIGGGFAADYEEGKSPPALRYAEAIVPLLEGKGLEILMEPGRQISCNSGLLLTAVQYVKKGGDRNFVIVDAAMTDLIRPTLYQAQHPLFPVKLGTGQPVPQRRPDYEAQGGTKVDIVGGVCESGDFLAKDRVLPPMSRGDLLAVFAAGAYGFVMSSQYNSRPRAAEVLVEGSQAKLIRRRETYDDLVAAEREV